MLADRLQMAECCTQCPYFDKFHRSCTHDLRQVIIQERTDESTIRCPVFSRVRAKSMHELERQLSPQAGRYITSTLLGRGLLAFVFS